MLNVNEVAKQCGLSVRALHYYDQIGLLAPDGVSAAGYRLYGERSLGRLQELLFLRELGFPLKRIAQILDSPNYDRRRAMEEHRELLILQRDRLNGLIGLVERNLKGEKDMSVKEFDSSKVEQAREKYAAEAKQRWGETEAYAQSEKKTKGYSKEDWQAIQAEADVIFDKFAALVGSDPASEAARALLEAWQDHITNRYYRCTKSILAGLGQMYVADPRFKENLDAHGEGTAQFMSAAIAEFCK